MLAKKVEAGEIPSEEAALAPAYGLRGVVEPVPKYSLPAAEMPPSLAYQLVHDELNLDGNPALNLASFVTTWMEPEARQLMAETLDKNYIDQDEYPQTAEIQSRCVNILARLFNAPTGEASVGTATVGSSEAIHLAGLALKWRWRRRRASEGKPADSPNIVMGQNVQVCWEKFARYFEVEPRYVPMAPGRYVLGVPEAMERVDENTIGVVGILGSTFTGEYEPIEELNGALTGLNSRTGWDVPIHVDGASGAFVAPFLRPELRWDFRLPLVRSINTSGHKYGLVYPGVGWVIWRTPDDLPDDLVFHVNYLGGDHPTFNLNFSRGAGQVLAQYYNFLRLGRRGYTKVMANLQEIAGYLAGSVQAAGGFELLSKPGTLPLVCFRLADEQEYSVFDLAEQLRARGWIVPAYTLPPDLEDVAVLRIVAREGFSRDMASALMDDIGRAREALERHRPAARKEPHAHKTRGVC